MGSAPAGRLKPPPASAELRALIASQDRSRPWLRAGDCLFQELRGLASAPKLRRRRSYDRAKARRLAKMRAYRACCPVELIAEASPGTVAVLDVIAWQVKKAGFMDWCNEKIAAVAGVSIRTVQRALAWAKRRGLLSVFPRKRFWNYWRPNLVRIVHKGWLRWILNKKSKVSPITTDVTDHADIGVTQAADAHVAKPQGYQKKGLRRRWRR